MDEPDFDPGFDEGLIKIDLPPGKWRLVADGPLIGVSVSGDGTVTHFHEEDGEREEWTEHISESPIRNVFGGWLWDLVLDPRDQGPEAHDPA